MKDDRTLFFILRPSPCEVAPIYIDRAETLQGSNSPLQSTENLIWNHLELHLYGNYMPLEVGVSQFQNSDISNGISDSMMAIFPLARHSSNID